jgi:archaellum component FlaF (FlaF/FlaG flagellin family)/glutaredoxin
MPKYNKQNIDRKTNKPALKQTEGLGPDLVLNRAMQTRRDDDVIRSVKRTAYDIDYAIKWYLDNEIQPQITANETVINVPVIFANGEKWDNVRRLGYIRDEKGMLQSPLIMLKRNSIAERDNYKTLDVNRPQSGNQIVYRQKYNTRNRYEDELFPIPTNQPVDSEKIYIVDIPKYVTIEYDMMVWCDFTTQLNDLIDQILPYGRFAWGNDANKFATAIGSITFETVNTVGEDRLVRATVPLTVHGTLISQQEARIETIRKMYSLKKVSFDVVVDVGDLNIFITTQVPQAILQNQQQVISGGSLVVSGGGSNISINAAAMAYLTNLTEKQATYVSATTVTVSAQAAINPVTNTVANVYEFDLYINGQYIDKSAYTWTPSDIASQTIVFDPNVLGYVIESTDLIIVKGRWA